MFKSVLASKLCPSKPSLSKPPLSKPAMALAAALALGSLPAATGAVAQYRGDGGGEFRAGTLRSGFRGDGFRDGRFRGGGFRAAPGFAERRGPASRGGFPRPSPHPYALRVYRDGYYEYYYYGCYDWRWAATPWGWRWRRVNVCYPSDE
jgi:hypothetical protein